MFLGSGKAFLHGGSCVHCTVACFLGLIRLSYMEGLCTLYSGMFLGSGKAFLLVACSEPL